MKTIKVWDLPLRLFHWLLVVSVIGAYFCIKSAGITEGWLSETGLDWMTWHSRFGYAVLALVLFRFIWGFAGPHYARFSQFVRGPRQIAAYLRTGHWAAGHNPLGAWSVIAMLVAFGTQAVSGLFASDDILFDGPLSDLNPALSVFFNSVHHASEWVLITLVILHLCAIVYYSLIRRRPLVRAMFTGKAPCEHQAGGILAESTQDNAAILIRGLVIALLCGALVYWISGL